MSQMKAATPGLLRGIVVIAAPTLTANTSGRVNTNLAGITKENIVVIAPVSALTAGYELIRANCTTDGVLTATFANFTTGNVVGGNISFKFLVL